METQATENGVMNRVLPVYKCHKEVGAAKILRIERGFMDYRLREAVRLVLINPEMVSGKGWVVEVSEEYMDKHKPEVGGYFVRYADGYQSYSPAQAFEEGYTLKGSREDFQRGESGPRTATDMAMEQTDREIRERTLGSLRADPHEGIKPWKVWLADGRPPLGVMPENLWMELRIIELAQAIQEQVYHNHMSVVNGRKSTLNLPLLLSWSMEMYRNLRRLEIAQTQDAKTAEQRAAEKTAERFIGEAPAPGACSPDLGAAGSPGRPWEDRPKSSGHLKGW